MVEWIVFGVFLVVALACRSFAPELIWDEPANALAQTIEAVEFSAALAATLTLAKLLLMYRRFRSDYNDFSNDLRGSRQLSKLAWQVLQHVFVSLIFAAIIVAAQLREPTRPADSWFDFAMLSACIYMGIGSLLGLLRFLPLFTRTSH
jgi:hypothetical protein